MEEIKVIDTKVITDNSKVVLLSIGGVKYIFTEATSFFLKIHQQEVVQFLYIRIWLNCNLRLEL